MQQLSKHNKKLYQSGGFGLGVEASDEGVESSHVRFEPAVIVINGSRDVEPRF